MLISLCMIVKNEEKVLGRCLESVQGLVDEIIIVDTGSDDRTKEIAKQYTDQVYDFEWTNDFAAARNESIRHARGDWILVMDADEYIEQGNHEQLKSRLKNSPIIPQCLQLKIINFQGERGEQVYESTGARLFTNNCGIFYSEPIHEQITCLSGPIHFTNGPLTLYHTGYLTETVIEKDKNKRNMAILQNVDSESKRQDPYFNFVLGNEYSNADDWEQACVCYAQSMKNADELSEWYPHLLNNACQAALRTKQFHQAERYIRNGIRLWPDRADYYCLEGILYESFGFYGLALRSFQRCLDIVENCRSKSVAYWVVEEKYGQIIPHLTSAEISRECGDLHQLVYHLTAAIKLDPGNFAALRTLVRTLTANEPADKVRSFLEELYPLTKPRNAFILFQVSLSEGASDLALTFWEVCRKSKIPVEPSDELAFDLLLKRARSAESDRKLQQLSPHLALFASIATRRAEYLTLASSQNDSLALLYNNLMSDSQGAALQPGDHSFVTQLLVQLLRYGYPEEYDWIIHRFADGTLLESLADQLSDLGYIDMSINLYNVLHDNGLLHGRGYKRMGHYYFMMGNPEEGLKFIEGALELEPSAEMLGLVFENCSGLDISGYAAKFTEWMGTDNLPEFVRESVNFVSR